VIYKEKFTMKVKLRFLFIIVSCFILNSCSQSNNENTGFPKTFTGITSEKTTTTAPTETAEEVKLEWGMSVVEVKSAETYELTGEDTAEIDGVQHTLLKYEKVPYMEHNTQMTICFGDDGLDRINYKMTSDNMVELTDDLLEKVRKTCDEVIQGQTTVWHDTNNDVTLMLIDFDNYVVFSVMPLLPENDRQALLEFLMSGGEIDDNGSRIELLVDMDRIEYDPKDVECDPINKSLDCEKILLEKADEIQKLFRDFLRLGSGDAFEFGDWVIIKGFPTHLDAKEARSDEIKTIADIKSRLNASIYHKYTDYLMYHQYGEANGKLYRLVGTRGGWLGVSETWYIGYDVTEDSIVGHFAVLGWGNDEDNGVKDPVFLNDINSYEFYDITVQNVGGTYVVTDVRGTTTGDGAPIPYDYFECHGCYYNYNEADRSLITNEAVKPRELPHS